MTATGSWTVIALGTVLSVWLVATVINSTPWGFRKLGGREVHHFIPRWNFFAPDPGVADYHLLYRDTFVDGGVGPWQEVSRFHEPRDVTAPIWHPDKHGKKALFDLTQELLRSQPETESEYDAESSDERELTPVRSDAIKLTTAYIVLLNYVSSVQRSEMSVATQFLIMREAGVDGTLEPIFTSDYHTV
ncbi:hypothetical protein [Natrinema salaciae]|uniref:Uncharacterized protein n=1 Tax=Natrinema salaciae TaxID=1186196 RepID=A0A1H9RKE6_9EURY|nr:hypothetical protein [Natrinema salaciae]SER72419.1 hypothetical protein SAMN04489841_4412 [Natrinema salaciae]